MIQNNFFCFRLLVPRTGIRRFFLQKYTIVCPNINFLLGASNVIQHCLSCLTYSSYVACVIFWRRKLIHCDWPRAGKLFGNFSISTYCKLRWFLRNKLDVGFFFKFFLIMELFEMCDKKHIVLYPFKSHNWYKVCQKSVQWYPFDAFFFFFNAATFWGICGQTQN